MANIANIFSKIKALMKFLQNFKYLQKFKYLQCFKCKKILKYTLFSIIGLISLYFIMIIGIVWEYSKQSFSASFICSKEECGDPPLTPFFLKFVADYKYNNKKAIEDIGVPPILWIIGFTDIMSNDEIIEMIDHFIKMGFDVNEISPGYMNQPPYTPLKAAILYKNFDLVKALLKRGALIQHQNPDLDALLYAEKFKKIKEGEKNSTTAEIASINQIILFLKEKAKNEYAS